MLIHTMSQRKNPLFIATHRVSSFDRIAAKSVDLLLAAALFSLGNAVSYALGVVACFTFLLLEDGWGPSVGKRLFGLRVLHDGTDRVCSSTQSALRNVPFALGVLFGAIPAFWVFFALIFLPMMGLEIFFVLRLDSGARLGDVLADTYVDDKLRKPTPAETVGSEPSQPI
jgi:uncharacterized RDD family membrane protein YckC